MHHSALQVVTPVQALPSHAGQDNSMGQHSPKTTLSCRVCKTRVYQLTSLLTLFTSILCQDSSFSLRHRSPPRPPLHVACLPLRGSPAVLLWWSDASCAAADRYQDWTGGSARGIADVDNWTIRLPREPLPCHRCEYGGYCGTWSSVNESLLTYLWRNSVKDFPRLNQSSGSRDTEEGARRRRTRWRGDLMPYDMLLVTHMHPGDGTFVCDWNSQCHRQGSSIYVWRRIKLEQNRFLLWRATNLSLCC